MAETSYAEQLASAISLAAIKHGEQLDKGGHPYLLHLMRVAAKQRTIKGVIVGWLHDIVEDTDVTLDDLRGCCFSEDIVRAVDAMSRREGESYSVYIGRVMSNPIAIRVKLADLEDNIRPERFSKGIGERERNMLDMYAGSYRKLLAYMHGDEPKDNMVW